MSVLPSQVLGAAALAAVTAGFGDRARRVHASIYDMRRNGAIGVLGAAVLIGGLLGAPTGLPRAAAEPCPQTEVVFARGSGEPVGAGGVGQALIDALRTQVPDQSIELYPVNYPATHDYRTSAEAGAGDATAHVQSTIAACPQTKIVLGGYSQGAMVTELTSERLPADAAAHIAAVTLFGTPTSSYAVDNWGGPVPVLAEAYRADSIDFCLPDDIVCAEGGNMLAHLGYANAPIPQQAAEFVADRIAG